jgi:site-specific recombinase XerD
LALDLGIDVSTVQTILRHANVATTLDFYTKSSDRHRAAAVGKVNDPVKALAKMWQ